MAQQYRGEPRLCRCGGVEDQKSIRYIVDLPDGVVIVENVPTWVCRRCGETYFAPDVSRRLEEIVRARRPVPRRVDVPVYDFVGAGS